MIGMHLAVAAVHSGTICASSLGTVGSWLLLSCTLVYYWHMYCLPFLKKGICQLLVEWKEGCQPADTHHSTRTTKYRTVLKSTTYTLRHMLHYMYV
jgi:hypothetical protein